MTAHRNPVHALPWIQARVVWLAILSLFALLMPSIPAQAAKPFPVDQFSYYLSDYDYELAKLAKDLKKTEAELLADIQSAETAGNARLTAAAIEQLLTKRPTDSALWLKLHSSWLSPLRSMIQMATSFRQMIGGTSRLRMRKPHPMRLLF
jgi:hypothetical protein